MHIQTNSRQSINNRPIHISTKPAGFASRTRMEKLLAFFGLCKLQKSDRVDCYSFKPTDIITAISKQQHRAFMLHGEPARRLIIGSKQHSELLHMPDIRMYITYNAPLQVGRNGEYQILGLQVEVVPWVDALIVLP